MIQFLLNNKIISTDLPRGTTLLDLVRYERNLKGTKIGCREGDCGACSVLVGTLSDQGVKYQSMTSCLLSIATLQGKHVVTIEGVNMAALNPIQQAMADEGATQCGFCTPGFVMSLAGFCLNAATPTYEHAIAAIDGNICRCTGYKSIERAARKLVDKLESRKDEEPAKYAVREGILPAYFIQVKELLGSLQTPISENSSMGIGQLEGNTVSPEGRFLIAGGTDLYVQRHEEVTRAAIARLETDKKQTMIYREGDWITLGPSVTVTHLMESPVFNEVFPSFFKYAKLVSSTPIRNMATVAGNFVNASPIGDLTIFFLALNAEIDLATVPGEPKRRLALRNLYKGYKQLDKSEQEYISGIYFKVPPPSGYFHFEKVSKRTHLDIASVNTAILISVNDHSLIQSVSISAGGVAPIPLYLRKSCEFLTGKKVEIETIKELLKIIRSEISPISDARGTKEYKNLLLIQLIKAHFIQLFPALDVKKLLH